MSVNRIVHFSDASMLGIHALMYLAQHRGERVQTKEIANYLGISENHLAKVMQSLVRNQMVYSIKGPSGGFLLAKEPENISLKDIIEIVDGPLQANFCPFSKACNAEHCIFGSEITGVSHRLVHLLEERTLQHMITETPLPEHTMKKAGK
ncbi:MAG: Rrf2 family transcriptional regulator [Treponemataceae bacterium]|nr:Rrf2 family transcriptional regulator [Treponemataceae bacterium]